jgi:hypothetical protein
LIGGNPAAEQKQADHQPDHWRMDFRTDCGWDSHGVPATVDSVDFG